MPPGPGRQAAAPCARPCPWPPEPPLRMFATTAGAVLRGPPSAAAVASAVAQAGHGAFHCANPCLCGWAAATNRHFCLEPPDRSPRRVSLYRPFDREGILEGVQGPVAGGGGHPGPPCSVAGRCCPERRARALSPPPHSPRWPSTSPATAPASLDLASSAPWLALRRVGGGPAASGVDHRRVCAPGSLPPCARRKANCQPAVPSRLIDRVLPRAVAVTLALLVALGCCVGATSGQAYTYIYNSGTFGVGVPGLSIPYTNDMSQAFVLFSGAGGVEVWLRVISCCMSGGPVRSGA
jgi:hypothetical protein